MGLSWDYFVTGHAFTGTLWEVFPDTSCVLCPKNQKHTKLSSLCMCPYKYVIVFDEFDYGVGESVCCTLRNFLQARAA